MRTIGATLEFRVKLASQEERMVDAFDHLNEVVFSIYSARLDPPLRVVITILIIAFSAMTMSFDNFIGTIDFCGQAALF